MSDQWLPFGKRRGAFFHWRDDLHRCRWYGCQGRSKDKGDRYERQYNKIKDWIVVYNAQEYSSSQGSAGAAISGAKVKLSKNGRVKYKTTTDSTGTFVLEKVKAGEYTLKVFKKGYKRHTQSYQMNQSNVASMEITLDKK